MRLKQSPVNYDRAAHTYELNGVRLRGVTEVIKYQLHPESYSGISDEVLAKAARKGSMIHDMCETYDNFGIIDDEASVEALRKRLEEADTPESVVYEECAMLRNAILSTEMYRKMTTNRGFVHEVSEYVVSDEKNFASPIDKVYKVDESTVDIADIKTISSLKKEDIDKVAWQLSIYKVWFERLNPDIKVRKAYVIWLPDKKYWTKSKTPSIREVEFIAEEEVDRLFECEVNDEKYLPKSVNRSLRGQSYEVVKAESSIPAEISAMSGYITSTLTLFKQAEAEKKTMVEKVRVAMEHFGIKSWITDTFSFTKVADSVTKTLDIERLKAEHPEIDFDAYYIEKTKKGGFTAKVK